ncbi:hypothetical protein JGU66_15950 [Myxococcaceae bacterium JPH2]|nr:hypothetical protein [Myxococcaceae bacterium JPH2]
MTQALRPAGHQAPRERWTPIALLACALTFAAWLAHAPAVAPSASPASEPAQAARVADAREDSCGAWSLAGLHDPRDGAVDPSPAGRFDAPRPSAHPAPFPKRAESSRAALATRLDAAIVALTQRIRACALPPRHVPVGDRPRTVNCPAQGPPRAA